MVEISAVDITRAEAISGWMAHGELLWLAERASEARTVVEIGCSRGRSTRALGDHVRGAVWSIDPWPDVPEYGPDYGDRAFAQAHAHLRDLIEAGKVRLLRSTSHDALPRLAERGIEPDFVFIDGDHSYEACRQDILDYLPIVRKGGVIAGHDYNNIPRHAGVRKAVDELLPSASVTHSIWWARV